MEDWSPEDAASLIPTPPKGKPFYSVSKQRAQQQIRNASSCRDISLKRQRLQAALAAANVAGLPEAVLISTEEELIFTSGATQARRERTPTPEPPTSKLQPMRAVSPVRLRSLGNLTFGPSVVAFLTLRDDGIAELRDAADPYGPPSQTCHVFDDQTLPSAQVHAVLQDGDRGGALPLDFSHQALWELFFFCEPFRAVIAVVDVLRPSGQMLCSQLLSKGPQGPLVGVIAACPGLDTPAPFAGPSFGALSASLCLGGEKLGLGGFGWAGAGVFGRCLALADRAVAYDGGWPSARLGQLAFGLASAAEASQGPGGMAGSYLFGQEAGSPEELVRAESIYAWLQGAGQSAHTSRAWVSHFAQCGVREAELNDGPMWMESATRLGRWPHLSAGSQPVAGGQEEEAEENADEDEATMEAAAAAKAAAAEKAAATAKVKGPWADTLPENLPLSPDICSPIAGDLKVVVPFGLAATALLGELGMQMDVGSFTALNPGALPDTLSAAVLQQAEVLFLVDCSDPRIIQWPVEVWTQWIAAMSKGDGVLVAMVLLPGVDAPESQWYMSLLALRVLIESFSFVIFAEGSERQRACWSTAGLLDKAVPMKLMAAHLSPFPRLHFAIAYAGSDSKLMVDSLDSACCVSGSTLPAQPPSQEARQALLQQFAKAGVGGEAVKSASDAVGNLLQELVGHCGFRIKDDATAVVTKTDGEQELEEGMQEEGEAGDVTAEGGAPPADPEVTEGEEAKPSDDPEDAAGAGDAPLGAESEAVFGTTTSAEVAPGATLLSFVIGSHGATAELANTLQVRGDELLNGSEGPSLAYPVCCYGYGCAPPKPWGVSWGTPRTEVVAFAVHTRKIFSIMARILVGMDDEAFSLDRELVASEPDRELVAPEAPPSEVIQEPTTEGELSAEDAAFLKIQHDEKSAAALKIQQAFQRRKSNEQS